MDKTRGASKGECEISDSWVCAIEVSGSTFLMTKILDDRRYEHMDTI